MERDCPKGPRLKSGRLANAAVNPLNLPPAILAKVSSRPYPHSIAMEGAMSALKFCAVQPKKAVEGRRRAPQEIILDAIGHQINLLNDSAYVVERQRYQKTEGGCKRVMSAKPPRKWWFQGEDGNWYVQVHLGTKLVELEKSKPTLACGVTETGVIAVLEQVAGLIREGKFADAISAAHAKLMRKKVG